MIQKVGLWGRNSKKMLSRVGLGGTTNFVGGKGVYGRNHIS